ncbi:MAG: T9SS type A sorting domain-containing protein [Crocinitomicaceae bacterium]
MKRILLGFALISSMSFGQQTINSVQDGDFFAFGTWDCFCLPADGDTVNISHDVHMNFGIPYTMGIITVNASGSLSDGGVDKDIYINGGSFVNNGTVNLDGFWLDSGDVVNNGLMLLDSLLSQDMMINNGEITVYDFAHDQGVTFENNGIIEVTNNFNNQGHFTNNDLMTVVLDASICNIQSMDAMYINNGILCVENDFAVCGGDTLTGTGTVYIGAASVNDGVVNGTLHINTPSGAFGLNTGTVGSSVTFGTDVCGLTVDQENISNWNIFPNPATDFVMSTQTNITFEIFDLSGKRVISDKSIDGKIDITDLTEGVYLIKMTSQEGIVNTKKFMKR